MSKIMDQALVNVFGEENTTSYIDALVAEDEVMISDRIKAKNRRAVRVEDKKNTKIRNKRTYDPSDVRHWSKKAVYNEYRSITPVFHGQDEPVAFIKKSRKNVTAQTFNKVANRKIRYTKIHEEDGNPMRLSLINPTIDEWNFRKQLRKMDAEELFLMGFTPDGEFEGFTFKDVKIHQLCPEFFDTWEEGAKLRELLALKQELEEKVEDLYHEVEDLQMTLARICGEISKLA